MTNSELQSFIEFLRLNGVAHYKGNLPHSTEEVELVLHQTVPAAAEPETPKTHNPLNPEPRGPDGLTREQQEELYGAVLDAPES